MGIEAKVNEKKCSVIAGAHISDTSVLDNAKGTYVICADGGYDTAIRCGIVADVLIGDFDTLSALPSDGCEIIAYAPEKDDTDTMLAIKLAIERGYTDITIYGAVGGRLDHTYANIQSLEYIDKQGCRGMLAGDNEIVYVQSADRAEYNRANGCYFSVFSLSDKCEGIYLEGVKYPLCDAVLERSFPLGVSNEITADMAIIRKSSGKLLIIIAKKN